MQQDSTLALSQTQLVERLAQLRTRMRQRGASWCVVRATDCYLSEYVPADQSRRVFITGFTGSVGDALVGLNAAFLFVDGRYALQAKEQAVCFEVKVLPLGVSIEGACVDALRTHASGAVVLIEEDRVAKTYYDKLLEVAKEHNFTLIQDTGIVDEVRFDNAVPPKLEYKPVWPVSNSIQGTNINERLALVQNSLNASHVDAFLLVALDDIAWLSGFRGSDFAYQATFAARGIAFDKEFWMITPHQASEFQGSPEMRHFEKLEDSFSKLASLKKSDDLKVGYDPDSTPIALVKQLLGQGISLKAMKNPVGELKAHKSKAEIEHMYSAFARADKVVFKTQTWLCDQVMSGASVTEADVDSKIRKNFADSGTVELSFHPICGYAKNGAIIHHTTPDSKTSIKEGELFLLDTGGIYEGGYSTDLTRTFLIGSANTKAKQAHKQMFTLVLKGAITGMSARIPKGTTGIQLDAMVRAVFWQLGLNYAHGTGHGIGINVHEFPPRVATVGQAQIEIGHVFSIEPGLYIPNFGGVRIENLCTVVEDPECSDFLRVVPLTFAPLDERLIEDSMLTDYERVFLSYFRKRYDSQEKDWNRLPPLDEAPSELMRVLQTIK